MAILLSTLQRSLTRLELAMAAIVIFIIAAFFLKQVLLLSARAEQRFLEVSVININTSLHHHAALLYLMGQRGELVEMDGMNPFQLMQTAVDVSVEVDKGKKIQAYTGIQYQVLPTKYQGEVAELDPDTIEPGNWVFDTGNGVLVYRVSNDEFFYSENNGSAIIRFRVTLNYEDRNSNDRYDPNVDIYLGVKLKNLGDFRWQI